MCIKTTIYFSINAGFIISLIIEVIDEGVKYI